MEQEKNKAARYLSENIAAVPLKNASGVEYLGLILIESALYTSNETPGL